mgnify:FL=1
MNKKKILRETLTRSLKEIAKREAISTDDIRFSIKSNGLDKPPYLQLMRGNIVTRPLGIDEVVIKKSTDLFYSMKRDAVESGLPSLMRSLSEKENAPAQALDVRIFLRSSKNDKLHAAAYLFIHGKAKREITIDEIIE